MPAPVQIGIGKDAGLVARFLAQRGREFLVQKTADLIAKGEVGWRECDVHLKFPLCPVCFVCPATRMFLNSPGVLFPPNRFRAIRA